MGFAPDHDAVALVGNWGGDGGIGPHGGIRDLHAAGLPADFDAIAEIARHDAGPDRVVASRRGDQNTVTAIGRGKFLERANTGK